MKHLYEFGPYQLDTSERLLMLDGRPVGLEPKAFDLLIVLVERSGHLVEKDELMKAVWPDTIVEEGNITRIISILRKALAESSTGDQYIETVPKRGYRFTASVKKWADEDRALVVEEHLLSRISIEEQDAAIDLPIEQSLALPASEAGPRIRQMPRPKVVVLIACAVAVGLVIALAYWWKTGKSGQAEDNLARESETGNSPVAASDLAIKSLAVLPFKTLGHSSGEQYLELGMADALITRLSNIKQIVVRPTSAMLRYATATQDPLAAGHELGVDALVDGRLQQDGDRLRVTVQLLRVRDGRPLWAEKFDTKFTDIFAVEDSISLRVAEALALELSGGERGRLAKHYTENVEAYQLYLKGRYYADKLTSKGFQKSFEYLKQAIAIDPNYALAWDGLAYCHINTVDLLASPREAFPRAREAAERALAIDDQLAEAHNSLAIIEWQYGWNWPAAEREFRRAIELNPGLASAHNYYGFFLGLMGRFDEAIAEVSRAQELDPLTTGVSMAVAQCYYHARRYDKAIELMREVVEMDPNFWLAHVLLGRIYEQTGKLDEAIAEYEQARRLDETTPETLMDLGRAYGVAGKKAQAEKVLIRLREQAERSYAAPFQLAMVYVGLADKEQAFAWLEKAYEARSWYMTWLKVEPALDSLRADPRFIDLLGRVGFVE